MGPASKEERRRKPWMQIEVKGGGGFLVLGGALIAAGLGAAFAAHRAHINNKRSRSAAATHPADEARKGISCNGEVGQLEEVHGVAARGLASLLVLDPTPTVKLAEDWQGEFLVHSPMETEENIIKAMIDQSPSFKHLEISMAREVRIIESGGDNVVHKLSLDGSESVRVRNQKEQFSEKSELMNLKELEGEDFSFRVVEFTEIKDKNNLDLKESKLGHVRDEERKDDSEEEEFSFRVVESDTIQNQTKQTLEEWNIAHAREQEGGGEGEGEEESYDDIETPSSESEEDETDVSTKGESEREEEGSDGTRASSIESIAEAVWPAEVIEQEKAEQEIEEKFVQKVAGAVEESIGKKMGAGPKTIKKEKEIGVMPLNYSNRFLLLLLVLALALSLISFAHHGRLHRFCLAKLYHHLYQVFFPSHNTM